MTQRRRFLQMVGAGLLVLPSSVGAQPARKVGRVGVLLFGSAAVDPNVAAFREGLREAGYVDGGNVVVEYRSADGNPAKLPERAAELVRLAPDVLFAFGGDVAPVVKQATNTIPIVMVNSGDPVKAGLVASLARPGGNVTGVTLLSADLAGKRLQFLKEIVPTLSRVGVLWNPDHADDEMDQSRSVGRTLGIQVQSLEVRGAGDFDRAVQTATRGRAEAVVVVSSRQTTLLRARILEASVRHKLPIVGGWGPWAQGGALFSYGPDVNVLVRRATIQVDRILKGARPADLPVEQPTKFELLINLRTALAFDLTVPPSLLQRADQVID